MVVQIYSFFVKMAHLSILESAMCLLSAKKIRKKYSAHMMQNNQKHLYDFFGADIILFTIEYLSISSTFFKEMLCK